MAKKVKKVTKDELQSVQNKVNAINQVQMQIGGLEVQKAVAIDQLKAVRQELNMIQKTLEEKYGNVSVNLQDGSLKEIPAEDGSPN
jgi:hypothetical protein